MKNCEQRCNNKQIKVNEKQSEINKVDNKPGRYSTDELKQFIQLKTELKNLTLDLQRCIDECKLRNRHRDNDSTDGTPVAVDPGILQELEALEKEEEHSGGRTRSTIRRRNKNKTKRRQTRSTRRRKTRRRRRRTRKQ
jgi:hypothetical protein